jgi:lysozyme family protein
MVGPSLSDTERSTFARRLRVGFVLLVAVSGASTALQGGAGPAVVVAATVAGALVGAGLLWYLARIT